MVAILDEGLESNHPDFNNISPLSFNSETQVSPSTTIYGSHGVAVAGIIGANSNNNLGVSGVSPNITLMNVINSFQTTLLSANARAVGINWAYQNGASIINCSWHTVTAYDFIDIAIQNASNLGRGGLGTLIIFSAGNDGLSSVSYPSNNPNVISVGAINMCNTRVTTKSCGGANYGSNYGSGLDVVAPGVKISTTDRQGSNGYNSGGTSNNFTNSDYTNSFGGTSASAPFVSGIAALILSYNPNLTASQVKQIIESSTDKIPGYGFTLGTGENPNLTWNNQVGYGKVNAYKALYSVFINNISGPNLLCSTNTYSISNLPSGYTTISWSVTPSRLFSGQTSGTGRTAVLSPYHTNSSGEATILYTVNTSCGQIKIPKTIWVGLPSIPGPIIGNTNPGQGSLTPYYINELPKGASSLTWSLPYCVGCSQPWSFYSGQNDIAISAIVGDSSGLVQVSGTNSCGASGASMLNVTVSGSCNPCPRIYPNPVSNELTIEWIDDSENPNNTDITPYTTYLFNSFGKELFKGYSINKIQKISLKDLPNGFYIIHIETPNGIIKKQLQVKK